MAIEVDLQFEYAVRLKIIFPFPLVTAKLIGNYFGIKGCGANNYTMSH